MNRIKNKLRAWLFPEYDKVRDFMTEIRKAKLEVTGKSITFREPIVLVGNISECMVSVKPTLKPEIILSKLGIEAALKIMGNYNLVTSNMFQETMPKDAK